MIALDICLAQLDPSLGWENLRALREVIGRCPADLYVLPELFVIGFDRAAAEGKSCAESVPNGPICMASAQLIRYRPASTVVAGILEKEAEHCYNSAVVIGNNFTEVYRQKHPAIGGGRKLLPVIPGDLRKVWIGPIQYGHRHRIGLMICSDHYAAEEFFAEYQRPQTDVIVMIADSTDSSWWQQIPVLCQKYNTSLIFCNAAGTNKGSSCVVDANGAYLPLRTRYSVWNRLPEFPTIASASLPESSKLAQNSQ